MKNEIVEVELRKSEERYRALITATAQIVWTTNALGEVVDDLPAFRAFTGQSYEQIKGWGWLGTMHPDDQKRTADAWSKAVATHSLYEIGYRIRRYDGEYRYFFARGVPVLERDGSIREWIGTLVDITERKKAEEVVQKQQKEQQVILDSIQAWVFYKDKENRFIRVNKAFCDVMEMSVSQLEGKSLFDFYPKEQADAFWSDDKAVMDSGESRLNIVEPMDSPKGRKWVRTDKIPYRDENGNIIGIIGFTIDITETKETEVALKEAKLFTENTLNSLKDVFYVFDPNGKFLLWNQSFKDVSGYRDKEISLMKPADLFSEEDKPRVSEFFGKAFKEGYASVEAKFVTQKGSRIPYEFTGSLLKDTKGNPIGLAGTGRDLTERKRIEEELKKYREHLEELVKERTAELESEITEHRRAEEALRESEERNRTTLYSIGDAVITTDTEGHIRQMNPVAEQLTGWNETDAQNKLIGDIFRIVNEETRAEVENPVAHVLRDGLIIGLANHSLLIGKDNIERPIADSGAPIHNERGDITGVVLVFRDQTEERVVQKTLQESEHKFRETVTHLDEGWYNCAMDGVLIDHNLAFNRILGFELARDLKGSKLPDFWQYPNKRNEYLNELLNKSFITNYLIDAKTITNEKIVIMANAHLVMNEKGTPVRIEGTFTDITEWKRMEDALRESESKFKRLYDSDIIGVIFWDTAGNITQANDEFLRIVGYTQDDILSGKLRWKDMTPPEYAHLDERALKEMAETGVAAPFEKEYIRKDGSRVPIHLYSAFFKGRKENGFCFILDLTKRKQAEEALQKSLEDLKRSNAELEQFAYVASHDLQEPLRMVSSYTQLLERRYKDKLDEDAKDFINFAVDGANRMQRLINDLLEYSRVITRGKEFVKLDLSSVLGIAVTNLHNKIQETNTLVTSDDLPFVWGDEIQLSRLFQNLIDNAIKFRKEEAPRIHISSRADGDKFIISIQDNGIGIDEKYKDRVFEIFQRLHNKTDYPGTGIGLSICKRIIERHGGKIWFESVEGKGTKFYFTLNK